MSESETIAVVVIVLIAAAIFLSWSLAWRRRRQRDAGLQPQAVSELGGLRDEFDALVLATTRSDNPLERVAVRGLALRTATVLAVHDGGLVFRLPGSTPDVVVGREQLRGVGRANWALDRGSGGDRIVVIRWWAGSADDGVDVDTALRHSDPGALVAAVSALLPADASLGDSE